MTDKSRSLEVISSGGKALETGSDAKERRRLPRLNLSGEQFRLSQNGKVFSVCDLSIEGMALRILDRSDLILFPIAALAEGLLNLRREKYRVSAKVVRIGQDVVGLQFGELAEEVQEALARFMDPHALAQEMKPIPVTEGGGPLWYHGPSGTDLLLWRSLDGQYFRLCLYLLGTFVQWEKEAGLSTGRAEASQDPGEIRGIVRFETMLLTPDPMPDSGKLNIAKTLIMSSNLPQDLKRWCSRQIAPSS